MREDADCVSTLLLRLAAKSLFTNILLANALWNWGDNGRAKLPLGHVQRTKALLVTVLRDMCALLLLPTLTRGRHRLTVHGRAVASRYEPTVNELQLQLMRSFKRLHEQVEVMKAAGLPANEASRVNQYHWLLQARLEKLQNIKVSSSGCGDGRGRGPLVLGLITCCYVPYSSTARHKLRGRSRVSSSSCSLSSTARTTSRSSVATSTSPRALRSASYLALSRASR